MDTRLKVSYSVGALTLALVAACGGGGDPGVDSAVGFGVEQPDPNDEDARREAFSLIEQVAQLQSFTAPDVPEKKSIQATNGDTDRAVLGASVSVPTLIKRQIGWSESRIRQTAEVAPASKGEFRTVCGVSHMAYEDPIVFPNQPGRSHLHTFFGNTGVNAYTTPESLRNIGNSTCRGGLSNRSAYWVPTMLDLRTGNPVTVDAIGVYYKTGMIPANLIKSIPKGLRMVAGDASRNTSAYNRASRFKCIGGPAKQNGLYGQGIANCDAGATLFQEIFFPQCWDGKNLDSPDHKSHMSYWIYTKDKTYVCPDSHPVALPEITFNIAYLVPKSNDPLHWRLSSDKYDSSLPGGYSSHGDWFNGWQEEVSNSWAKSCLAAGKDCHSHLLGDGRMIF